jgi:hypothetical protein
VSQLSKKTEYDRSSDITSRFDRFLLKILQHEKAIKSDLPNSLRDEYEPETGAANPFELKLSKKKINKNVYSFKFDQEDFMSKKDNN